MPSVSAAANAAALKLPYAAFTVPHFDKFMEQAIPDLEVPPIRRR
jgi:hypothetical protein